MRSDEIEARSSDVALKFSITRSDWRHCRPRLSDMRIIRLSHAEARNDRCSRAQREDRRTHGRRGCPTKKWDELAALHRILVDQEGNDFVPVQRFQNAAGGRLARDDSIATSFARSGASSFAGGAEPRARQCRDPYAY